MGWTLGLLGIALWIYRPWQQIPFDITDFSELLPLLTGTHGSFGRLGAILGYYAHHGRSNILTSAMIWIQWEAFGLNPPAWRLMRVLLFGLLIWTFVRTAARFRSPLLAAGLGASLFVVGRPAAEGWIRLTGEPLATVFLLLALGVAATHRTTKNPARTTSYLAILSAAMVLSKETMLVCLPMIALVALTWNRERFQKPSLDGRAVRLSAVLGATAVLLAGTIFLVSEHSPPDAYARVYGPGALDFARFQYNTLSTAWPLGEPIQFFSAYGAVSVMLLVLGWGLALRRGPPRTVGIGILYLALLCTAGAAVYLPWPRIEAFYAIPFMVGSGGLFALAVTGLMGRSWVRRTLTAGAFGLLLLPPALVARRDASGRAALRLVNWDLAKTISTLPQVDSLFFAVPFLPDQSWQGRGPTLVRYAGAVVGSEVGGRPVSSLPISLDETCASVGERLGNPPRQPEIIVSYHNWCGALPEPTRTISRAFRAFSIRPLGIRVGRVVADVLLRVPQNPQGTSSLH